MGKALLHGFLAAVGMGALAIGLGGMGVFADPQAASVAAGRNGFYLFLLVTLASLAHQRRRSLLMAVFALPALALVALQLFGWGRAVIQGPAEVARLPAAEEQGFPRSVFASSGARLCQNLGFSFPEPSGFEPAPSIQSALNNQLNTHGFYAWAFEQPTTGERVLVQVALGMGRSETNFRSFTDGLRKSTDEPQVEFVSDDFSWSETGGTFDLAALIDGVAFDSRCVSSGKTRPKEPLIVCLQTIASSREDLAEVRDDLRIDGCAIAEN